MSASGLAIHAAQYTVSPLMLADQLLTLAQNADRSGLTRPAERLLETGLRALRGKAAAGVNESSSFLKERTQRTFIFLGRKCFGADTTLPRSTTGFSSWGAPASLMA